MAKDSPLHRAQMRERIAQLAARLIADEGIGDFAAAKRKAARQLGAPDTHNLPSNLEIESALRTHHMLYRADEHAARLAQLRRLALEVMGLLRRFDPQLTGPVLSGTAGKHAPVEIHLFADSAKEIELFLLNEGLPYETSERRYRFGEGAHAVPLFRLFGPDAEIELSVFSHTERRLAVKSPIDGKPIERARPAEVEALLSLAG